MAADPDGFHCYSLETRANGDIGARQRLFHSRKLAIGPTYSYDGAVAVIATTDRATMQHYNLLAFDTATGAQIAELWDGPGTSVEPWGFAPQPGDLRMAGTTSRSGVNRPFLWNLRTGARIDLQCSALSGEVVPVD